MDTRFLVNLFAVVYAVQGAESLQMWETSCLATHNELRTAHGLDAVLWDDFLHALSDLEGLHMVLEDANLNFGVPPLDTELLRKELITFSRETKSKEIVLQGTDEMNDIEKQLHLSLSAELTIRDWFKNGLFQKPENEKYQRIMDPTVDKIGCALHSVGSGENWYKLYLIVGYKKNLTKTKEPEKSSSNQRSGHRQIPKDLTCNVNCTDSGSCYSYKQATKRVGSRTGRSDTQRSSIKAEQSCKCEFDPQQWELGSYSEKPHCDGPCFVYCPFTKDSSKVSCYGDHECTCLYADGGGAVCN